MLVGRTSPSRHCVGLGLPAQESFPWLWRSYAAPTRLGVGAQGGSRWGAGGVPAGLAWGACEWGGDGQSSACGEGFTIFDTTSLFIWEVLHCHSRAEAWSWIFAKGAKPPNSNNFSQIQKVPQKGMVMGRAETNCDLVSQEIVHRRGMGHLSWT